VGILDDVQNEIGRNSELRCLNILDCLSYREENASKSILTLLFPLSAKPSKVCPRRQILEHRFAFTQAYQYSEPEGKLADPGMAVDCYPTVCEGQTQGPIVTYRKKLGRGRVEKYVMFKFAFHF
jgi:hypothetical protein